MYLLIFLWPIFWLAIMADVFSREERSAVMRRVRSVDTTPELAVRRIVHRLGFRYRLHTKDLPGKPDMVFRRLRKVIFVNGCYWHQHSCEAAKRPTSNRGYWNLKLDRNLERDKKNRRILKSRGWDILTVWECETRNCERLERALSRFLRSGAA